MNYKLTYVNLLAYIKCVFWYRIILFLLFTVSFNILYSQQNNQDSISQKNKSEDIITFGDVLVFSNSIEDIPQVNRSEKIYHPKILKKAAKENFFSKKKIVYTQYKKKSFFNLSTKEKLKNSFEFTAKLSIFNSISKDYFVTASFENVQNLIEYKQFQYKVYFQNKIISLFHKSEFARPPPKVII